MTPPEHRPAVGDLIAAGLADLFEATRRAYPALALDEFREAVARRIGLQAMIDAAVSAERRRNAGEGGDRPSVAS